MTVKAVPNKPIDLFVGVPVWLDGTASEGTPLTFEWRVISGQTADDFQLADASTSRPKFAPLVTGTFVIELTVSDGRDRASASTIVTALPLEAIIEGPERATVFDSVRLDGSKSRAPEGSTFEWTVTGKAQRAVSSSEASIRRMGKESWLIAEQPKTFQVHLKISKEVPGAPGLHNLEATTTKQVSFDKLREIDGKQGTSEDVAFWAKEQIDDTRGALTAVQTAAQKWEASLAAILGVFATVTFVAGPDKLADVGSAGLGTAAIVLMAVAFAMAISAFVLLARAGHGAPGLGKGANPQEYRELHWTAAKDAVQRLRRAKQLSIGAAAVIAFGSVVLALASLHGGTEEAQPVLALVRLPGRTLCGELASDTSGNVKVAGNEVGRVLDLTIVEACGAPPVAPAVFEEGKVVGRLPLALVGAAVGILGFWLGGKRRETRPLLGMLLGVILFLLIFVAATTGEGMAEVPMEYSLIIPILLIGLVGFAVGRWQMDQASRRKPSPVS